jgi:hypothetical protein
MTNATFRRWAIGLWLPLALSALVIAGWRLASTLLDSPYNTTTTCEDISIFNISRVRYGEPAYTDCFRYPYRTSVFNWLFYRFFGGVALSFDASDESLPLLLRMVTVVFTVVGLAASLYFLRTFANLISANNRVNLLLISCFAVLVWLGPVIGWYPMTVRPDIPAVVLEYLGLMLMALAMPGHSVGRSVLAGMLFFLGWSLKQNEIGIFLGTLLALAVRRDWFNAGVVLATWSLFVGIVFLSVDRDYRLNVVEAPALAPWVIGDVPRKFGALSYYGGWYLLMGVVVLYYGLTAEQRFELLTYRPVWMSSIALGVCFCLNLIGTARQGSALNYYFETWVLGITLTGFVYLYAMEKFQGFVSPFHARVFAIGIALVLLNCGFSTVYVFVPLHKPYEKSGEPQGDAVLVPRDPYPPGLVQRVRTSVSPMFCDDPLLLLQALGRNASDTPVIEYTIYLDALKAGQVDDGGIEQRIRQRWFATLWIDAVNSRWEEAALKAGYERQPGEGLLREWILPGPRFATAGKAN